MYLYICQYINRKNFPDRIKRVGKTDKSKAGVAANRKPPSGAQAQVDALR